MYTILLGCSQRLEKNTHERKKENTSTISVSIDPSVVCEKIVRSVKAGNRKSGGITQCFFLVKSCQLEVRGFDIKIDF